MIPLSISCLTVGQPGLFEAPICHSREFQNYLNSIHFTLAFSAFCLLPAVVALSGE